MTDRLMTILTSAGRTWTEYVEQTLRLAGHRASGPRSAVLDVLGRHGCLLTVRELADELRAEDREVGIATIYRTLELLEGLGLVQRLDVGKDSARYEPSHPTGRHHHHVVCDGCGRVTAFEDSDLERAIVQLAQRLDYRVGGHDITLRGDCAQCAAST